MGSRLLTTRWRWRTGSGSADPARPLWPRKDSAEERRLREAVRIFAGLGALAAARITGQKMCQLGIRSIPAGPRIAARAPRLGLTRREQEALDLICAGHTNAQIAAKLFSSAKTAGHHVSACWRNGTLPPVRSPPHTLPGLAWPAAGLGPAGAAEDREHRREIWVTTPDPGRGPAAIRSP